MKNEDLHISQFNEAFIFSANENENKKIDEGYVLLRKIWFFLNSDSAQYEGKEMEKIERLLHVSLSTKDRKTDFAKFYNANVNYNSKQNNIILKEEDFIRSIIRWINNNKGKYAVARERKLIEYELFLNSKLNEAKDTNSGKGTSLHPDYDPNFGNNDGFGLFKYLYDNYYDAEGLKKTKRKLLNIWFYLTEYDINKYYTNFTKEQYITFIDKHYSVLIRNKGKAEFKYPEKEYPSMNSHRIKYEDSLK